jgi:hypothetical protein
MKVEVEWWSKAYLKNEVGWRGKRSQGSKVMTVDGRRRG